MISFNSVAQRFHQNQNFALKTKLILISFLNPVLNTNLVLMEVEPLEPETHSTIFIPNHVISSPTTTSDLPS